MKRTYVTSLLDIFTPAYDMSIGQKYTGNHSAYLVTFWRNGDTLTVSHFGNALAFGPVRALLKTETHSISAVCAGLIAQCQEHKFDFDCKDDIPEGHSVADYSKIAAFRR